MTQTQEALLNLTLEIDEICRKHEIQYFLEFGSALGGLRHHGFIPWDNDLDLVMKEEDYNRFKEVCEKELDHTTRTFMDNRTNRDHPSVFGHYTDLTTFRFSNKVDFWNESCGQRIDIFCMLELPGDPSERKDVIDRFFAYDEFVNRSYGHYLKKTEAIDRLYHHYLAREKEIGFEAACRELEEQIFGQKYPDGDSYLMGSARFGGTWPIVPRSAYETARYVEFEGHPLPLSGDCVELLYSFYGDSFSRFPRDKKIHSEMSHTGIPARVYVEDYMRLLDREKMLEELRDFKDLSVENGLRLNRQKEEFYRFKGSVVLKNLHERIEKEKIPVMEWIRGGKKKELKELENVFQEYIRLQSHESVLYWRVHFGLEEELEYAAMYVMFSVQADYTGIVRLLHLRSWLALPITEPMREIEQKIRHIRNINKYLIYEDLEQARENLDWCKAHCPEARNLSLWELRYLAAAAQTEAEAEEALEYAESIEKEYGRKKNQYFTKAEADLLRKSRRKEEARKLERWLKEHSDDGLLLLDLKKRTGEEV